METQSGAGVLRAVRAVQWSPALENYRGEFIAQCPQMGEPIGANHHLWLNNGIYYLCVTILINGVWQERLRPSLRTRNVCEARRRRDILLAVLNEVPGAQLSLRYTTKTSENVP